MQSQSLDASDAFSLAKQIIETSGKAESLSVPAQRLLNLAKVLVSYDKSKKRLVKDPA